MGSHKNRQSNSHLSQQKVFDEGHSEDYRSHKDLEIIPNTNIEQNGKIIEHIKLKDQKQAIDSYSNNFSQMNHLIIKKENNNMHNSNIKMLIFLIWSIFSYSEKPVWVLWNIVECSVSVFICSMIILEGVENCPVLRHTSYISSELFIWFPLRVMSGGKSCMLFLIC